MSKCGRKDELVEYECSESCVKWKSKKINKMPTLKEKNSIDKREKRYRVGWETRAKKRERQLLCFVFFKIPRRISQMPFSEENIPSSLLGVLLIHYFISVKICKH